MQIQLRGPLDPLTSAVFGQPPGRSLTINGNIGPQAGPHVRNRLCGSQPFWFYFDDQDRPERFTYGYRFTLTSPLQDVRRDDHIDVATTPSTYTYRRAAPAADPEGARVVV